MEKSPAPVQPLQTEAGRVSLPLIGHDAEPTVVVTNEDIEDASAAADVEGHRSSS
jgi:hypothetical protein